MSRFLKVVGLGMVGIVLLLCGLIALYYFESKAALRADIKACPTVTAGQATDAVIQDILVNRERVFSKPQLERRDIVIEELNVQIGYTGILVPFRITGVNDRRFFGMSGCASLDTRDIASKLYRCAGGTGRHI
ncbi:Uncharacterised protein [Klebsiella pneumoniae]|uniref:Phosphonate ABC transporter substrate-binding protein n=1 Tax=Klebsiella pneumoniae TaxID=573 RepID=A0A2X3IX10_KLEPN|nr:Uncharacterised protein [Klebsiella pneumoniae]HDU1554025.1 phosphonate ABC transporter substrate-binding protein [Klebsiella pneumoniae]